MTSLWNFSESFATNKTGSKDLTQVIDNQLKTSHSISLTWHIALRHHSTMCLKQSRVRQDNLRKLGRKRLVGGAAQERPSKNDCHVEICLSRQKKHTKWPTTNELYVLAEKARSQKEEKDYKFSVHTTMRFPTLSRPHVCQIFETKNSNKVANLGDLERCCANISKDFTHLFDIIFFTPQKNRHRKKST